MARERNKEPSKAAGKSAAKASAKPRRRTRMLALEPRILFDGAMALDIAQAVAEAPAADTHAESAADTAAAEALAKIVAPAATEIPGQPLPAGRAANALAQSEIDRAVVADGGASARTEIVFVDTSVEDYQTLLADINPNAKVVLIDGSRDGIQQIADYLASQQNVDAIHIVSHGTAGSLQLGSATLDADSMRQQYAVQLIEIGTHLSSDADILVYGCDFAKGEAGADAAIRLSNLTGADVAASENLTGAAELGGDWNLERAFGQIETSIAFRERAQEMFQHVLATLDWDAVQAGPGWTGNTGTYSAGGANVTVTVTDPGGDLAVTPGLVRDVAAGGLTANTGGLAPAQYTLGLRADFEAQGSIAPPTEQISVTINFAHTGGVSDVSFTIFDIDNGTWIDRLVITGNNGAAINPTSVVFGTSVAFDGTNTLTGVAGSGTTSSTGNATITFAQSGLTSVTILYQSGQTADATVQQINLHDINFNVTPLNTIPGAQTVEWNSAQAISGVSVNDVDGNLATTQLSVANGAVNVNLAGGAMIAGGANGSASLTLSGTQAQINAALATLAYTGGLNYAGADTLTVISTDLNGRADTDTVAITVAPDTVLDLNSTPSASSVTSTTTSNLVANGDMSTVAGGVPTGWTEGGDTGDGDANSGRYRWTGASGGGTPTATLTQALTVPTDTSFTSYSSTATTLTQTTVATANAITSIAFDYAWENADTGAPHQNTLEVRYNNVLYATFTSGGAGGATGSWAYFNGATGTAGSGIAGVANETTGALSSNVVTLGTPVAASGNLVFTFGNPPAGGASDDIAIDNVVVTNSATTLTTTTTVDLANNGWTAAYIENGAAVSIADTDSSVFDGNSANLTGGTITLTNFQTGDLLRVNGSAGASGTLAGGINWTRSGANGEIITLSNSATNAQYADAIESIAFENTSNDPSTTARSVTVNVTDGAGLSNTAVATINVTAVNDEPTLTATGANPTFTEGAGAAAGTAVDLFGAVTAGTVEAGQTIAQVVFTVTNVVNGAAEVLTIDGASVALVAGSGSTLTNSVGYTISFAGSTATVTLDTATPALTPAQIQTLVDGLTYQNTSQDPTSGNRVVTITGLTDSGSNVGANDNVAAFALVSTVNVVAVDDPSVLTADTNTVAEDNSATGNVLSNDIDVDNTLTVTSFQVAGDAAVYSAGSTASIVGVGTVVLNSNGGYTFTPVADYNGTVPQLTYTVSTGSTSTLDLTVTPADDSFADANETVSVVEDSGANSGSVLTGTSSVDGPVTVTQFLVAGDATVYAAGGTATIAGVGTLQIAANGAYTFTPVANYNGAVPVVTYTVTDGSGTDDTSTISFSVSAADDSFADANETVSVVEDSGANSGSVLTGTSSVDGPVTVTQFLVAGDATVYAAGGTATIAGVGTLQIAANGAYTFTPVANYNGAVPVVTYTVTDGSGTDDTSTISFSVSAADDSFADANETVSVVEDSGANSGSVLTGTSSVDGPVTVTQFLVAGDATVYAAGGTATIAGVGTLQIAANGAYTFTPVANYNGAVPVVTYTVTDGSGTDDTSTISFSVSAADDSFADANETVSVVEDSGANSGSVLTGTSSVDGPVTVTQFLVAGDATVYAAGGTATIAGVGTLQIAANGAYTFTPVANYNGAVPVVTYTVTDGSGTDDTSTISFSVSAADDSFADANETVSVVEDSGANSGSVLTGTSSVDGPVTVTQFLVAGDATVYAAGGTATIAGVGTLQIAANGAYTFTPVANYNGAVPVVTYTVTDGSGTDDTSTISFSVSAADDSFADANETVSVVEDSGANSGSVLTGTSSVDGPVTVTQFLVAGDATVYAAGGTATIAGVGTLQIAANGAYTFTPVANYNGAVPVVTYTVTDGSGTDDTSTISFSVSAADDSFADANETVSVVEDSGANSGSVLTGTSSVDGPVTVTQFLVAGDATVYAAGGTATIAGVGTLQIAANGAYTFTPVANYNGAVPVVTYTVTDGSGTDDTSTISFSVSAADDSFADANETVSVVEDSGANSGSVLTGTSSVDGPVTVTQFLVAGDATVYAAGGTATIAGVGTLQIAANGAYTFTPVANYNGAVPVVTYTVTDGSGTDDTSTISFSVSAADDSFADANETVSVVEDSGANSGSVLTGTSSVDGPVTVTQFLVAGDATVYAAGGTATIAGVGTLQIAANGAYTFTPVANYNGAVPVVTYTVTDGSGTDDTSTISFSVSAADDSFADANETVSVVEDSGANSGSVLTGTSSVDGPVTVTQFLVAGDATVYAAGGTATIAGVGTLQIAANGAYTFTPVANYNGAVPVVTYTVTDGSGTDDTSTISFSVSAADDSFADANETVSVVEDSGANSGSVLTGTSSVDGPVTVTQFLVAGDATVYAAGGTATIAGVGTLQIAANGAYTFTPVANYNGAVPVVTYTVTDGSGTDDTSTISFSVSAADDSFADANETVSVVEDSGANSGSVLTGTSSVDGPVTVTQFLVAGDATVYAAGGTATISGVGTLQIAANGAYTFTPVANYNGAVPVVTYTVTDGSGTDDTSTISFSVSAADDSFADANETVSVVEDSGANSGSVLTGTSSVDGPVTVTQFLVAGDATVYAAGGTATISGVGTLQIAANGAYTFTPVANYNGAVPVVTYTVTDGSGTDDTSTISFSVSAADDSFADANETVSVVEDSGANSGSVLTGTSSVDGPVTVTQFLVAGDATVYAAGGTATISGVGTLQIAANGAYTFTPVANYNGAVPVVTYTVTDGSGTDDTSTISFSVSAADDSFADANETVSVVEDSGANSGSVLTGTSSVDGPVTVTQFLVAGDATVYAAGGTATISGVGTLQIAANGAYTFTPVANYNGAVPVVTYTVTDGSGTDDTSTISFSVSAADDSFADANETVSVVEDSGANSGSVLTGTSSVDGPVTVTQFLVAGDATVYAAGGTATISGVGTLQIAANGAYTFTPVANYNGAVPVVTYTVTDGSGTDDTSTISFSVSAADDSFADANETVSVVEDSGANSGSVLTGTSSVDGPVTVTQFLVAGDATVYAAGGTATISGVGTLQIAANGAYTFTPVANYNGAVPVVTYTVTDGSGTDDTSTISFSVSAADDSFADANETVSVVEDSGANSGSVLTGTSSVDGPVTVTQFLVAGDATVYAAGGTATISGVGTLQIAANGAYTFTPVANYNGAVPVVTYTVTDGSGTDDTSTISFSVSAADDSFADANETVSVVEDSGANSGSVLTGTSSVDGPVTVTQFLVAGDATVYAAGGTATISGVGTLQIAANGAYTFTPVANYNGAVPVVTYTVTDGSGTDDTSTISFSVSAADDSFADANETVSVVEDSGANSGSVLTGTSSVDGPVTVTQFLVAGDATVYAAGGTATISGVGTLQIAANGAYTFTPVANYNGAVPVVTYTVTDGSGTDDTSTISFSVSAADDSFADANETVSVVEDSGANSGSVLTGTSSVDGPVTVTQFLVAGDATVYAAGGTATIAGVGTLQIAANGAYTFTPVANYNGAVPVVTYTVTDGSGTDDTSTISFSVSAADDSFADANETVSVVEDSGANSGSVLTGTSSVDGPVTVTQFLVAGDATVYAAGGTATIAGVGTLQIAANGAYTFTPVANYNGAVPVVTYTVTDGSGTDDTSTISFSVSAADDSFADANETVSVVEDSGANSGSVLTGTSSVDGPVTVTQFLVAGDATVYAAGGTATIAGVGTLQIAANGAYTFTPVANYNGAVPVVTYTVTDGSGTDDTSTISFSVSAADDSFADANETVSVVEDSGANSGSVLTGTSSVDGPVTVTQFLVAGDATVYAAGGTATIAGVGTLQIAANGAYTFTPVANYNGAVPVVTYTVTDGSGTDDTSTISFSVSAADDSFADANETVSVVEDSGANSGSVLTGTSSVDGPVTVTQFLVAGDATVYAAGGTATIAGVGTLQIAANGAYTFTPVANYNGAVPVVTYTVTDGSGTDDTSTISFSVSAADDSFADANETVSVVEDSGANSGSVLTGTSSVDGPVTVTQFLVAGDATVYAAGGTATIAGVGTLQIAANGAYTFTPVANYNGAVPVVTYTVTDGSGTDDTSTISFSVSAADDSFADANETVSVVEDSGANSGSVLTGTSSVDGPVTVTQFLVAGDATVYAAGGTATIAGVGTLQIAANGAYTFTPVANYNGAVPVVTYTVTDGSGTDDTSTISFSVSAADDSFADANETVSVVEDSGANSGSVLTGTSSVDGPVTVTQFLVAGDATVYAAGGTATIAGVGTLQIAANGAYTFTPVANYNGAVPVVTYTVTDGSGTDDTSTISFSVSAADDSFADANETVSVVEDSGANSGSVLTGTSSVDGPVTVTQFLVAGDATVYAAGGTATIAGVGTLQIAANGAYTFTPVANYNGAVPVVTYTVTDGSGTDDTSTISFSVSAADDSFADANETVSVVEDSGANSGSVLTGTSSVDGPVTVTQFLVAGDATVYAAGGTATIAGVGTLQIAANGAYTFTPVANYNGAVPVVTYTVTDGSGTDDTSTISFSVSAADDSFADANETVSVVEDSGANSGSVLTGTSSVDGPVTVTQFLVAGDATVYAAGGTATIAGVGTLQIAANGAYTFTPVANYNGAVPVVTYTVTDGSGTDDTSTISFSVSAADDSFADANETVSVVEDSGANSGSVLTGTSSVDGPVTVTQFLVAGDATVYAAGGTATIAGVGTLQIAANGAYTFTPVANYNGAVPVVTYTVTDGSGTDDTSTISFSVSAADDSFADANETVSVVEDSGANSGSVLTGTSSVDGPVTVTQFLVAGDATVYAAGGTATIAGVGTLQIAANGAYTFTPVANYNGAVPVVTYTVTDGSGTDDTSTISFSVSAADDSFADANETVSVVEDSGANSGSVLTGTSSVDGPVTVTQFLVAGDATVYAAGGTATIAGVGTLQIAANGAYTFTPVANYNGAVPVVTYTVTDGSGTDDTSTISFSVSAADDSFADANETVSVVEDSGANSGSVLTGTSSVDGPVTVTQFLVAGDATVYAAGGTATIAGVGTLQIAANGAYTFTPVANYNGAVPVVTYTVTDGSGTDDTSTISFSVSAADDSFADANETVSVVEDSGANSGSVLTGTSSVDGPVTVTQFLVAGDATVYAAGGTATIAGVGTLQIAANGAYTFTPVANYNGAVPVVTYTVTDGSGTDDTSTISFSVSAADDSFADANETVSVVEDSGANSGSVLTGTSSVDGPVTVTQFLVAGDATVYAAGGTATIAGVGTLQIAANGAYTFTPVANYNGAVPVVTYTVTDGSGTDDTSTISFSVSAADDSFADANETVSVVEDSGANSGSVLTGTSSVDGPVTVTQFLVAGDATVYAAGGTATIAGVGTLQIAANGAYTFTPVANYNGAVPVVTYTVTDGSGTDDTSTISFSVSAADDSFADANETVSVVEDSGANSGSVLTGTSSVDGPVTVTQFLVAGDATVYAAGGTATIAGVGTLQIAANGAYTFTPVANYNGAVPVVTYTVTDGSGTDDTSTISFSVSAADDSFADANETVSVVEDSGANSGSVLTGTSSVDGPVTVTQFLVAGDATVYAAGGTATIAGVGTLQIAANGAYTFTPVANYNGAVPVVTYTVTDGSGTDDTSTISFSVSAADDSFADANETVSVVEDSGANSGSVLTGTSSVDGPVTVTQFLVAGDATVYAAGGTATIAGVGTLQIAANGAYTFTPVANYNGAVPVVTYTVTDGSGTDDTSTISFSVSAADDAPVLATPIPNQGATVLTPFSYMVPAGTFTDVDTPVLTYSATLAGGAPLPAWLTFTPATGAFSGTPPIGFGSIDVTVTASDGTQSANDTFRISTGPADTTPPAAPTVASLVTSNTQPTLSGAFDAADTALLQVTVNGVTYALGVDPALTASGNAWSLNLAVAGQTLTDGGYNITAVATDPAGNTATDASVGELVIDTIAPAPTIALTSNITADDIINAAEAGGPVAVTGTVGGDAAIGDTVTLMVNGVAHTGTVQAGNTFSINVSGSNLVADADFTIDASISKADAAGNVGTATDSEGYLVDVIAPAPTITLTANITADDIINAAEAAGTVAVTGAVGGDAVVGDTVTLMVNGVAYTGAVAAGNTFSINVNGSDLVADADFTIDASISKTDAAGNVGAATDAETFTVDVTVPAPTISLTSNITPDDVINATESGGLVAIAGTVGGDAAPGDTVTLTVNGISYTGTVSAGNTFSINVPGLGLANDADLTIDASISKADAAGNVGGAADTETYTIDLVAPAPTITLTPNITADDIINAAEAAGLVAITGTVGGDAVPGDTVTLLVNGVTYAGTVQAGNTFSINVAGADLVADADFTIDASLSRADAAGNVGAAATNETYTLDVIAPVPTVTLTSSITADDIIDAAEAAGPVAITGVVGGDAAPGDTVTLLVNGVTYTGTVQAGNTFSINVNGSDLVADADFSIDASISKADAAGNVGTSAASETYAISVTAPAPLTPLTVLPPVPAPLPVAPPPASGTTALPGLPNLAPAPPIGATATALGLPVDLGVAPSQLGSGLSAGPADAGAAIAGINVLPATGAGQNAVDADRFQITWIPPVEASRFQQSGALGVGEHRLFVFQGISVDRLVHVGTGVLRIPGDAFAHTDPVAVVVLEARLADGRPLPDWLKFDRVRGTLAGEPPSGVAGEIRIEIIARDTDGREARTVFALSLDEIRAAAERIAPATPDIELGLDVDEKEAEKARLAAARAAAEARSGAAKPGDAKARPQGAAGFSEQLKGASTARDPLFERIAKAGETPPRAR